MTKKDSEKKQDKPKKSSQSTKEHFNKEKQINERTKRDGRPIEGGAKGK